MIIPSVYLRSDPWLYLKIYCGHKTTEKILSEILFSSWKRLHESATSDMWFFIRYADPDPHLRFRVKIDKGAATDAFIAGISAALKILIDERLVWKIESGTYMPERERYGPENIKFAEHIFWADSEAFIKFLMSEKIYESGNRWHYAMLSIEYLLNDFNFSLEQKKMLLLDLNRNFGREFGKNKALAGQLSLKFRENRLKIKGLLTKEISTPMHEILSERSANAGKSVQKVLDIHNKEQTNVPITSLLSDLIHMSMNRIFPVNNRIHEMVLYDLMFRSYKSMMYEKCS